MNKMQTNQIKKNKTKEEKYETFEMFGFCLFTHFSNLLYCLSSLIEPRNNRNQLTTEPAEHSFREPKNILCIQRREFSYDTFFSSIQIPNPRAKIYYIEFFFHFSNSNSYFVQLLESTAVFIFINVWLTHSEIKTQLFPRRKWYVLASTNNKIK